eukprot:665621-Alexandrium_andersonii.AAC.1
MGPTTLPLQKDTRAVLIGYTCKSAKERLYGNLYTRSKHMIKCHENHCIITPRADAAACTARAAPGLVATLV